MRQFLLVALVTALLAGESYCLITTKSNYDHQRAQEISESLQENVLELSASLRNGELERYEQAKASYASKVNDFEKYANGSNVYEKLKTYQTWLDSSETSRLVELNAKVSEYNKQSAKAENIEQQLELVGQLRDEVSYSKPISEDLAKLSNVASRIQDCMSYCLIEDYQALEQEYEGIKNKLGADWEKINSEYEARLQSKALLESLADF